MDPWQRAYETELLLLDDQAPELEDDKSRETKMETEAAAVAARIREMVGNEEVVDKETGEYRKSSTGISSFCSVRSAAGRRRFRAYCRRLEFRLTVHQKRDTFPRRKL